MRAIIILLFISSFSLLLSFFGDYNGNLFNKIIAYTIPVLFWGGMIAAYVMLYKFNKKRTVLSENEKITQKESANSHNRI